MLSVILPLFSYSSIQTYVLGAQKNRLIETFLSTHNICFGREIREIILNYTLIFRGLITYNTIQASGELCMNQFVNYPE